MTRKSFRVLPRAEFKKLSREEKDSYLAALKRYLDAAIADLRLPNRSQYVREQTGTRTQIQDAHGSGAGAGAPAAQQSNDPEVDSRRK
jgi:hypothetical protein